MIFDKIEQAPLYYDISPRIKKGLQWLSENVFKSSNPDLSSIFGADEKPIQIEGEEIFAKVERYRCGPDEGRSYAVHRLYFDIHCVVSGEEIMRYHTRSAMDVSQEYNPEDDHEALAPRDAEGVDLICRLGDMVIIFPGEAHMPMLQVSSQNPADVAKVVVKVLA